MIAAESLEKVKRVILELIKEKADINFAAILEREDRPELFDIALASPSIDSDKLAFLKLLMPKLNSVLTDAELQQLDQVALLNQQGDFMREFKKVVGPVTKELQLTNLRIGDIPFRHAYILPT